MSQNEFESHNVPHAHSSSPPPGLDSVRKSLVFRLIAAMLMIAAVATLIGIFALWPNNERSEEIQRNAEDIALTSDLLKATVHEASESICGYSISSEVEMCRNVTVVVQEGLESGSLVVLPEVNTSFDPTFPQLAAGDNVILGFDSVTNSYYYQDRDRMSSLWWLILLFAVTVICLARVRGLLALFAMGGTVLMLVKFIAPSVLDGNDPVLVCVVAAAAIAYFSLYFTHGFSLMTTVALAGTLIALGLTLGISWIFFELAKFSGYSSEEAFVLPFLAESLDVRGLLLGGTIIAALGALDDVTVTQAATVLELSARNNELSTRQLMISGLRVGREHIASTVNTLLLAYAGSSIPLLLLFAVSEQSLGDVANSELIAIELVRTLCGSIGLVAALPITTYLAALLMRADK
ncbi:MAG: YibE/F family protein [Acidimicrobiales bacterium]|nr:YibE/F family protein [Acidimicrobiales bacterium]